MPYRSIEDPVRLRRVLEATLLIEGDLDLPTLLRHVIEEARSMTGARYGALGVLDDAGTGLSEFLTSGLDTEAEERIGQRPTGLGVLGLLISHPQTLRLSRLDDHPDKFGFPPNHPAMTSFLGVPIKARGEIYGNLYLTDKVGWAEFTRDDEALVEALAIAAGIAIENARLHQRVQRTVVLEDRDRVARDLHDTVIQRLFAVGLSLQSMSSIADGAGLGDRLSHAVTDIDETILQIRTAIYALGSSDAEQGVRAQLLSLVRELEPVVGTQTEVSFHGPVDTGITDEINEHLLAVAREALTNIGKHANATEVSLTLSYEGDLCRLVVADNGSGMPDRTRPEGLGLVNMRRRAEKLQGEFTVDSPLTGGTTLVWEVPADL